VSTYTYPSWTLLATGDPPLTSAFQLIQFTTRTLLLSRSTIPSFTSHLKGTAEWAASIFTAVQETVGYGELPKTSDTRLTQLMTTDFSSLSITTKTDSILSIP